VSDADLVVRFDDAAVQVNGRTVWSGVDVGVRRGEFVAVLGPNGAGKSTMIKTILGLVPLTAGYLSVLGAAPGVQNRVIGYVPQRRSFDAEVRIRGVDLVRLGLTGPRWGVPVPFAPRWSVKARHEAERVEQVIALVGAADYADRPIGELSGGEQQRLLIAQALAARPRLLLLDEPAAGMNPNETHEITELIGRLRDERKVTILLIEHDMHVVEGISDRVIALDHGEKVTEGTFDHCATHPAVVESYLGRDPDALAAE
jgi:zinc/manganese transport system ATP-binding protein